MKYPLPLLLFIFTASGRIVAEDNTSCLDNAVTQYELNQCFGLERETAQAQLARVLDDIKAQYQNDTPFLKALEVSQAHWERQLTLDLDMKYPKSEDPTYYGSVSSMCMSDFETTLVTRRIAFLTTWLEGIEEGDVCSGSVKSDFFLDESNE